MTERPRVAENGRRILILLSVVTLAVNKFLPCVAGSRGYVSLTSTKGVDGGGFCSGTESSIPCPPEWGPFVVYGPVSRGPGRCWGFELERCSGPDGSGRVGWLRCSTRRRTVRSRLCRGSCGLRCRGCRKRVTLGINWHLRVSVGSAVIERDPAAARITQIARSDRTRQAPNPRTAAITRLQPVRVHPLWVRTHEDPSGHDAARTGPASGLTVPTDV
jgi:hypothetical protein